MVGISILDVETLAAQEVRDDRLPDLRELREQLVAVMAMRRELPELGLAASLAEGVYPIARQRGAEVAVVLGVGPQHGHARGLAIAGEQLHQRGRRAGLL